MLSLKVVVVVEVEEEGAGVLAPEVQVSEAQVAPEVQVSEAQVSEVPEIKEVLEVHQEEKANPQKPCLL